MPDHVVVQGPTVFPEPVSSPSQAVAAGVPHQNVPPLPTSILRPGKYHPSANGNAVAGGATCGVASMPADSAVVPYHISNNSNMIDFIANTFPEPPSMDNASCFSVKTETGKRRVLEGNGESYDCKLAAAKVSDEEGNDNDETESQIDLTSPPPLGNDDENTITGVNSLGSRVSF